MPNLPLDKKDFSFEEILDDLFRIGGENHRSMKHEEVPNRCDEETVGDTGHESCNPLNFPTFSVTNVFASVCMQDDKNININTTEEIEEVQVEDVGMDENHDIDPSNTKEMLQMSLAKDPVLVCMKLNDQLNYVQHTIPSSTSNEGKMEFIIPHK
ncbi:hypothetical protein Tco_0691981 [Tanacetum coccineum]